MNAVLNPNEKKPFTIWTLAVGATIAAIAGGRYSATSCGLLASALSRECASAELLALACSALAAPTMSWHRCHAAHSARQLLSPPRDRESRGLRTRRGAGTREDTRGRERERERRRGRGRGPHVWQLEEHAGSGCRVHVLLHLPTTAPLQSEKPRLFSSKQKGFIPKSYGSPARSDAVCAVSDPHWVGLDEGHHRHHHHHHHPQIPHAHCLS